MNCELCSTGETLVYNQTIGNTLTKAFGGTPKKYPMKAIRKYKGKHQCDSCLYMSKELARRERNRAKMFDK